MRSTGVRLLPEDFDAYLQVANAAERFAEARELGSRLVAAGVPLTASPDHAAVFTDPPALAAGPLKRVGYVLGRDCRCYPSPVDGEDYINVAASLPESHPARARGWWDHVAVVHPVDAAARDRMLANGYGNPFIHHLTFGIRPPEASGDPIEDAGRRVRTMVGLRARIGALFGAPPGDLIVALPDEIIRRDDFRRRFCDWVRELDPAEWLLEPMQGGGSLIQFFILKGGRIEVALRAGTSQVFNPKSVTRISAEEISTRQD